eukprot:6304919-Pyramimonas_sp.AAC.1
MEEALKSLQDVVAEAAEGQAMAAARRFAAFEAQVRGRRRRGVLLGGGQRGVRVSAGDRRRGEQPHQGWVSTQGQVSAT